MTVEFARQFTVHRGYHEEVDDRGDPGPGKGDEEVTGDRGDETVVGDEKDQQDAAALAEAKKAEEEAAEAKRAEEKAAREKDVKIPKERFDEAVRKERVAREAAERRAQELQDRLEKQSTAEDVKKLEKERDDLEEELDKAMADNEPGKKREIRAKIRAIDEQLVDARVSAQSALAMATAVEQVKYDALADKLEADYPFLVAGTEDFDLELTTELMELKGAYEKTGLGSTAALKKATETLEHKLKAKVKPAEDPAAKEKEEAAAKVKKAEEEAAAKRREAAVAKGQEAKKSMPPGATDKVGTVDKTVKEIKAAELSDEDFEKLSEAERKRLRGD